MPISLSYYCPVCIEQYYGNIKYCPICEVKLVKGEPPEYCENCLDILPEDTHYCPHCGTVYGVFQCTNHQDETAIAVCIICRKTLCEICAVEKEGKYFCEDDVISFVNFKEPEKEV